LGSVVAISDQAGNTIEKYEYSVYGEVNIVAKQNGETRPVSIVGNPYYFTGRHLDAETGLYYYRARMYSASLGRFLQTDPIGYADGLNWYLYCDNNPLVWIDPWGLCKDAPRELTEQEFQRVMEPMREELQTVAPAYMELSAEEAIKLWGAWDSGYYRDGTLYQFDGRIASGHQLNYYALGMLAKHRNVHPVTIWGVIHVRKMALGHFGADSNTMHLFWRGYREYKPAWSRPVKMDILAPFRMGLLMPLKSPLRP
jgi:RHS repeat-associated protein